MEKPKYLHKLYRQDSDQFNHIEGLRAFAALRVMVHHLALFGAFFWTPAQFSKILEHPFFKCALAPSVSLDVFFVISGFVIGYSLIKAYKKTGEIDFYSFFIRRGVRIFPLYLFVIVACAVLLPMNIHNVWANILQVNNMVPMQNQYAVWTWSIAIDFQFYVLFAITLWLLTKNIIGKKICTALAVGFLLMPYLIIPIIINTHHYYHITQNAYFLTTPEAWLYFNIGIDKLYVRTDSLLYGVITAYILVYHRDQLRTLIHGLSKTLANLISLGVLALLIFVFINDPVWFFHQSHQPWQTSTYWVILFQRNIFALSIALLILLADCPRGLIMVSLTKILKSVFLRPLGRLSYSTYMTHPFVMVIGFVIFFATHKTVTPEMYFQHGLTLILITYLVSLPLFLFLEQPIIHRVKVLLLRSRRRKGIYLPRKNARNLQTDTIAL
jgi:peptidoglycan/LPS O-acetylase OafA/YrhL